jgi:tetratricopeptide (TPR) repeat protein
VRRAIRISGKQYGAESSAVAQSLNNLALVHINQNQPALAESLYVRAIALMESTVTYNHSLWYYMCHLANLYVKQGRYGEAEPLYERAMAIKKKVSGYETFNEIETLKSLAALYRATGKDREADDLDGRIQSISPGEKR